MASFKSIGNTLLKSNSLIFTYLRSIVSSQCGAWSDYIVCFTLFSLAGLPRSPAGGVVNCIINYKFTFRANGVDWRAVVVKYLCVWVGSMLLNSYGTEAMFNCVQNWDWLQSLGIKEDWYFVGARLFVSLMVSWFWNFALQRYFVYRPTRFDPTAIRLVDTITLHKHKSSEK